MIRRKKLTAKARSSLRYKQQAPVGIGATRRERKELEDSAEAARITFVRQLVFQQRSACQYCGGTRKAECMGLPDQMHEEPSRAATRGRPLEERFNLTVCGRACAACHRELTGDVGIKKKTVFDDPDLGFRGRVRAVRVA